MTTPLMHGIGVEIIAKILERISQRLGKGED